MRAALEVSLVAAKKRAISKATIIRNRGEFRFLAKRGAFSLEACGDPVFRAREGFGRPGAKVSLHSGSADQKRSWEGWRDAESNGRTRQR